MNRPSAPPPFVYQLEPQYHARVWGGQHLKALPPEQTPIGEAWIVHEHNVVSRGPHAGETLQSLLARYGDTLLGQGLVQQFGGRFPLLIKLLDCQDWLSVQVHPNDEQARELVGPGEFGKTEAWHFLSVEPQATILAGVKEGTSARALAQAIRSGSVLEVAQRAPVQAGDTVFIPAGTLHALGAGMLLYEVQQTSDTTYRVYDWDRPAAAGRALHLEESVAVTRPDLRSEVQPLPHLGSAEAGVVAECPFFKLEVLEVAAGLSLSSDTAQRSLHALTVQSGEVQLLAGEEVVLGPLQTALVSAHTGAYSLHASQDARLLRASLPAAGA